MSDFKDSVPTQEMWNQCADIKLRLYWLKHKLSTQFTEQIKAINPKLQEDLKHWQEAPINWFTASSHIAFSAQLAIYETKEAVYLKLLKRFTKEKQNGILH